MSIIVTDMDMPANCFRCPLCRTFKTQLFGGIRSYCDRTKNPAAREGRRADCPLREVPETEKMVEGEGT